MNQDDAWAVMERVARAVAMQVDLPSSRHKRGVKIGGDKLSGVARVDAYVSFRDSEGRGGSLGLYALKGEDTVRFRLRPYVPGGDRDAATVTFPVANEQEAVSAYIDLLLASGGRPRGASSHLDEQRPSSANWTADQNAALVRDYFDMLRAEISGQRYVKAVHRRALMEELGRAEKAIEFKYQNVSAVLRDMGCFYVAGYKPMANYQASLAPIVAQALDEDASLRELMRSVAEDVVPPATLGEQVSVADLLVPAPEPADWVTREPSMPTPIRHRDYVAIEAANRSLGLGGELLVLQFERDRLRRAGLDRLADNVEHVSLELGDGAGFDIRSYGLDGKDRFVEVKTTVSGSTTPIYVTANEARFSERTGDRFALARVFAFRSRPRMFELTGPLSLHFELIATNYVGRMRAQ